MSGRLRWGAEVTLRARYRPWLGRPVVRIVSLALAYAELRWNHARDIRGQHMGLPVGWRQG